MHINKHMNSFRQYVEGENAPKFNRVKKYIQYYKNLSPADFKIKTNGDTIVISIPRVKSRSYSSN